MSMTRIIAFISLFCSTVVFGTEGSFPTPSTWLVSMEGHYLTWVLKIPEIDASGKLVGATYSKTLDLGNSERPINGSVSVTGGKFDITYTTPSDTLITLTRQPDGSFFGGFLNKKGLQKTASMRRVSAEDISNIATTERERQAQEAIIPPGADVPRACAFFSGEWEGSWNVSGYGQFFLWVEAIDKNCYAKIRYSDKPIRGKTSLNIHMEDERFSFVCNQNTGGTCVVTQKGEGIYVSYSNQQGGRNGAYLEKRR